MKSCVLSFVFLVIFLSACDKNETDFPEEKQVTGTGSYTFSSYEPFSTRPINCYYHIPENIEKGSPVLVVLHGAGRDASNMRDYLIERADQLNFIVLAPEFSEVYFPGSDAYNLGNIFEDGDHPSEGTLNPEEEWTFSVIDPIFDDFKNRVGNTSSAYDVFGHSAGSQILHRFLIFNPEAQFNRVVCAAAGWYNMPDSGIEFPYGLDKSPAKNADLSPVFGKEVFVIVGSDDVDPNSAGLRHTPEADAQGLNRLERAQYFYNESRNIADGLGVSINWSYHLVPNTGHDGESNVNFAADLLYN